MRFGPGACAATVVLLMAGCQSSSKPKPPTVSTSVNVSPPQADRRGSRRDTSAEADDCPSRLQEVGGLFLMYWQLNHRLPATLEDLRSVSATETDLTLSCPRSNRPFVYVPAGLHAPGRSKSILVYDPSLGEDRKRWCLLAESPRPGLPWSNEVVAVPQSIFVLYLPTVR